MITDAEIAEMRRQMRKWGELGAGHAARLLDELERTREALRGMNCGSYGLTVAQCIRKKWCDCPARAVLGETT